MRGEKNLIHMKNIQREWCEVQCAGSQFSQEKTQHIRHSQACRDIYWQSSQTWPWWVQKSHFTQKTPSVLVTAEGFGWSSKRNVYRKGKKRHWLVPGVKLSFCTAHLRVGCPQLSNHGCKTMPVVGMLGSQSVSFFHTLFLHPSPAIFGPVRIEARLRSQHRALLYQPWGQQWGLAAVCSLYPSSRYPRQNIPRSKRLLASSLPFNITTGDKTHLIPSAKICTADWWDRAGTSLTPTFETLPTLLETGWGSQARQPYCKKIRSVCFSHLQIKTNFSTSCRSPDSITHKWK